MAEEKKHDNKPQLILKLIQYSQSRLNRHLTGLDLEIESLSQMNSDQLSQLLTEVEKRVDAQAVEGLKPLVREVADLMIDSLLGDEGKIFRNNPLYTTLCDRISERLGSFGPEFRLPLMTFLVAVKVSKQNETNKT